MSSVPVMDLLELPYRAGGVHLEDGGVDCVGVARAVFLRANKVLGAELLRSPHDVLLAALGQLEIEPSDGPWVELGKDLGYYLLCDVFLTELDGQLHVSIVHSEVEQRTISAAEGHGVYTMPIRKLRNIRSVWRLSEDAQGRVDEIREESEG